MGRILRLLRKGMDFEFGKTKHESIEAGSASTEYADITDSLTLAGRQLADSEEVSKDDFLPEWDYVAANDSELDDVLSAVSPGDTIRLGPNEFSEPRTIQTERLTFLGAGPRGVNESATLSGGWTFEETVHLTRIGIYEDNVTIAGDMSRVQGVHWTTSGPGDLIIDADAVVIALATTFTSSNAGSIIFQSGTEAGAVGPVSGWVDVTDNGNNTVLDGT